MYNNTGFNQIGWVCNSLFAVRRSLFALENSIKYYILIIRLLPCFICFFNAVFAAGTHRGFGPSSV